VNMRNIGSPCFACLCPAWQLWERIWLQLICDQVIGCGKLDVATAGLHLAKVGGKDEEGVCYFDAVGVWKVLIDDRVGVC